MYGGHIVLKNLLYLPIICVVFLGGAGIMIEELPQVGFKINWISQWIVCNDHYFLRGADGIFQKKKKPITE